MNINRIISIVHTLKEQPTNSTGSNGSTAGFSADASASGPTAGYDKRLFPAAIDDLSQDYQSPGQSGLAKWRFSNVWPVEKVTEDVMKLLEDKKLSESEKGEVVLKVLKKIMSFDTPKKGKIIA